MKTTRALIFLLTFALAARATPLDDKMKALDDAMKAGTPPPMMATMRVVLAQQAGSDPGNMRELQNSLHQILANNPSPEIQKAAQAVLDEIQAERQSQIDAVKAKFDTALANAPDLLAKAQKPSDLDPLLEDLQSALSASSGNPDFQEIINRENQDYQLIAGWQDFLSRRAAGNYQLALNSLQQLQNSRTSGPVLIPRSQILDQINAMQAQIKPDNPYQNQQPDVTAALARIKTLDDLIPQGEKLAAATSNGMNVRSEPLCRLATLYARARSGLPFSLDYNSGNNYPTNSQPDFVRVEAMFMSYALPKFLGPDAPAQNGDESLSSYVDRVVKQANSTQNWPLLQRAITAKAQLTGQPTPPGTQRFLAGLSQEQAAQYAQAVTSYETALSSPDTIIPATSIGDRLAAIQKAHPVEYDEGLKAFLHPPAPVYPPGYGYPYQPQPTRPEIPDDASAAPKPATSTFTTKSSPLPTNTVSTPAPPKSPSSSGK